MMETDRDWHFYVNLNEPIDGKVSDPTFWKSIGEEGLGNECSISKEIALLGRYDASGLNWDVRIFDEKYSDLLTTPGEFLLLNLGNDDTVDLRGADFQIRYPLSERVETQLSLYYVDLEATSSVDEKYYSRYGGSAYFGYGFDSGYNVGFSYYRNHEGVHNQSIDRYDLNVARRFEFADQSILTPKISFLYRGREYRDYYRTFDAIAEVLFSLEYSH